jgi:hypothetical protein
LTIAEVLNDGVFIAQINFIIGRVYNIKQEYETSIYYHEKHLNLARQFQDSKGQCQAYFILSQLYERTNQTDKAKKYLSLYKALAREVKKALISTKYKFIFNIRLMNQMKSNLEQRITYLKLVFLVLIDEIMFWLFRLFVPNQLVLIYLMLRCHNHLVLIQLLLVI